MPALKITRGRGASRKGLDLAWEARFDGDCTVSGIERLPESSRDAPVRVVLSMPLPDKDGPLGVDLTVRAVDAGVTVGEATFPSLAYPGGRGRQMRGMFDHARIALYDPAGAASRPLQLLGITYRDVSSPQDLTLFEGDLIVIGPGGFTRGREALGPVLAARARAGMRVLLLDQATLPATLSEDLRLWPSFRPQPESTVQIRATHPVLRGISGGHGLDLFAAAAGRMRPLLPPERGNFRVLAEVRVPAGQAWQEGVSMLEMPMGQGTVLVSQADLCASFDRDTHARFLLANLIAYLLGDRPRPLRTALYGAGPESLPLCLRHLAPSTPVAGPDLDGIDLLLAPGDWQALRDRAVARTAPLARVARYLLEGGTMLLLNPQPLVLDSLSGLVGSAVHFESVPAREPGPVPAGPAADILEGIGPEDLSLLHAGGRPEFRLRPRAGPDGIEPLYDAPGIALYRVGRGTLLALTLPDASECSAAPVSSLLARLLTNLGVPLDPDPGADPEAVTRLDGLPGD